MIMKKYIFYLFFSVLQSLNLWSDDQQLFLQAHENFVKGNWAGALRNYRAINHKNSVVWQNIGSCYFNQQQYAQALLYWKRAYQGCSILQVGPLCTLEQKALKKLNLNVPSKFHYLCKRMLLMIPLTLLQIIFVIMLLTILWILVRCWRWQEIVVCDRRWLRWLLLSCFVCGSLWYGQHLFLQKNQAIVVKQDVLVYAGPERTFHVVKTLLPGNTVHVLQQKQGMYNITKHSVTGWVMQDTIEFIYDYE